jgi:hypothetical protein
MTHLSRGKTHLENPPPPSLHLPSPRAWGGGPEKALPLVITLFYGFTEVPYIRGLICPRVNTCKNLKNYWNIK